MKPNGGIHTEDTTRCHSGTRTDGEVSHPSTSAGKTDEAHTPSVICQSITKRYIKNTPFEKTNVLALEDISFEVARGEIFGIIGPDGAGKTTLFRILTTLLLADSGTARVEGNDVVTDFRNIRNQTGYMPGRFSLYQDLTVEENLNVFAKVFKTSIEENYHLIEDIYRQLEPFKNRRAGKLSGGMKQKLALCCALIHKPTVLFLDEPTTGVDPVSRKEFWAMLQRLKKEQITILVSTPYMDEAGMCDRIALIQSGKILQIDSPQAIVQQFKHPLYSVRGTRRSQLLTDLRRMPGVRSCYAFGDSHHLTIDSTEVQIEVTKQQLLQQGHPDNEVYIEVIKQQLLQQGHPDVDIQPIEASIEDCFLEMTRTNQQP